MDTTKVPVVLKAILAAFITGFSGAAFSLLSQAIAAGGVGKLDYLQAFHGGIAAGLVGVLAYLKASPSQIPVDPVVITQDDPRPSGYQTGQGRHISLALAGLLVISSVFTSACGNERTLAKVGYDINVGINSTAHVVVDLHNQAIIFKGDDAGYRSFLLLIQSAQNAADDLNKELDKLATLDATNVDNVLVYVDKLATQLVLARQIAGKNLPPQVVNAIAIGQAALNGARIVIAAYKPSTTTPAKAPKALAKIKYTPVEVLAN
jgi:hypothetical protein